MGGGCDSVGGVVGALSNLGAGGSTVFVRSGAGGDNLSSVTGVGIDLSDGSLSSFCRDKSSGLVVAGGGVGSRCGPVGVGAGVLAGLGLGKLSSLLGSLSSLLSAGELGRGCSSGFVLMSSGLVLSPVVSSSLFRGDCWSSVRLLWAGCRSGVMSMSMVSSLGVTGLLVAVGVTGGVVGGCTRSCSSSALAWSTSISSSMVGVAGLVATSCVAAGRGVPPVGGCGLAERCSSYGVGEVGCDL